MSDDADIGKVMGESLKETQRAERQQTGGGHRSNRARLLVGMWFLIALVVLWAVLWLALGWHTPIAWIVIVVASPFVALLVGFLWTGLRRLGR